MARSRYDIIKLLFIEFGVIVDNYSSSNVEEQIKNIGFSAEFMPGELALYNEVGKSLDLNLYNVDIYLGESRYFDNLPISYIQGDVVV